MGIKRVLRAALATGCIGVGLSGSFAPSSAHAAGMVDPCAPLNLKLPHPTFQYTPGHVVAMTPDARYAVFVSTAGVYLNDIVAKTSVEVSPPMGGGQPASAFGAAVTPNGSHVAFISESSNLVAGDTNGVADVFVRDVTAGVTERVSVRTGGGQAAGPAESEWTGLAISDDGRVVAFGSRNSKLVDGDTNGLPDVFVRDRQAGTTVRIDAQSGGAQAALGADAATPSSVALSGDGRYVAFQSRSPLLPADTNTGADTYVRDVVAGSLELISRGSGPGDPSYSAVAMSADGNKVAYVTRDPIAPGDNGTDTDVYIKNRATGGVVRVNKPPQTADWPTAGTLGMSPDGRHVMHQGAIGNANTAVLVTDTQLQRTRAFDSNSSWENEAPKVLTADGRHIALVQMSNSVLLAVGPALLMEATPFNLPQGKTTDVVLRGYNLEDLSAIDLGAGITASNLRADGFGQARVTATVDGAAELWQRRVTMTNGSGCPSVRDAGVQVSPGITIASISPPIVRAENSQPITIKGTDFASGAVVTVDPAGVVVRDVTVVSPTTITASIDVAPGALEGGRVVTVKNPSGASGSCFCLEVDGTAPSVLGLVPSGGQKHLNTIVVFLQDTREVDEAATEVTLTRNGATAPFTRDDSQPDMVVLHPTNPQDGTYTVRVRAHDTAGNTSPLTSLVVKQGAIVTDFTAYGAFLGGASVASGDLDGDGVDELVTAAGPGGGPHVAAWKVGTDGVTRPYAGFMAYAPQYIGGIDVATGDVDGDGRDEIITAAIGGGPHVQAWGVSGGTGQVKASWYAYAPTFTGGVRVAAGDVDGDGIDEVITGPASNGGPHVRVWHPTRGTADEVAGWMAYAPNFLGGLTMGASDLDGDGFDEVITGTGVGGGPHVQVFVVDGGDGYAVGGFMAYDGAFRGGVQVAGGDLDGDGVGEIVTAAGPGGGPHVRAFVFDGEAASEIDGFMAYAANLPSGVSVATGDPDGDGDDDIVTVPYRNAASQVTVRRVL